MSLADFQTIYETYKNDPLLQRLHERHTVIQTWDDHAIANNRYWDYEADAPVFPNHPCGDAPEFTRYLTRAGIQAWWEFVPGRIMYDRDADHIQESFELYRSVEFGDLVTLLLTDERLFRSRPLSLVEKARRTERADPNRSMLGSEQREWFLSEVRTTDARWAVWANAVLFTPFTLGLRWLTPGSDSWDGFVAERTSIMETFEAVSRRGETTVVTLTGDMHTTLATRVRTDEPDATPVAVEFMTPGVTSVNFSERVADKLGRLSRSTRVGTLAGRVAPKVMHRIMRRLNTDYALLDSAHWGYSTVEFTPDACTWDVYWVDKTVNAADAQADHYYRVRVPAGEYVLQDLSSEARDDGGTRSSSSGGRLHHSTTTDDAGRTRSSIEPEP
jgi:alkaline phosphatase D